MSKKRTEEGDPGLNMVQVQHASWRSPLPLHASYLSGRVREAQQTVPPSPPPHSTHLQLLQFSEAVEDLRDGLHTEVKSKKTVIL